MNGTTHKKGLGKLHPATKSRFAASGIWGTESAPRQRRQGRDDAGANSFCGWGSQTSVKTAEETSGTEVEKKNVVLTPKMTSDKGLGGKKACSNLGKYPGDDTGGRRVQVRGFDGKGRFHSENPADQMGLPEDRSLRIVRKADHPLAEQGEEIEGRSRGLRSITNPKLLFYGNSPSEREGKEAADEAFKRPYTRDHFDGVVARTEFLETLGIGRRTEH